jgi:hypothetical protein
MVECQSREDVDRVIKYMASHPGVDVDHATRAVLGPGRIARVPDESEIDPRQRAAMLMFADGLGLDPEGQWLEIKRQYAVALGDAAHKHHALAKAARSAMGGGGGADIYSPTVQGIRWPPHDLYYGSTEPFPAEQHVTVRPEPFTPRVPG